MQRRSKRFTPTRLSEKLVPLLLVLLGIGLLAVLVIIGFAIVSNLPAG
ncbi:MAG: hypothetical protein JXB38_13835 [Anaerolineales bacterium]|nr:hypothetical protein [Anaerolineales bacterium]